MSQKNVDKEKKISFTSTAISAKSSSQPSCGIDATDHAKLND